MSDTGTTTIQQNRSLADIVREKTNDGETIVQFYLDVASGKLDGFRDNHRMAAANKIGKIAPDLVAKYLVKYRNSDCRDSLRGTTLLPVRRPPIKPVPSESRETTPRGPSVLQRRLARIVREETGDGRAIVVFLEGVMHGLLTGFKPHHRLEAADKLTEYLNAKPDPFGPGPVLGTREVPVLSPAEGSERADSHTVRPEPACPEPRRRVEGPTQTVRPEPVEGRCSAETTAPVLSPDDAPTQAVRAEPTEDSQPETKNSKLETLPDPPSPKTPSPAPSAVDPPITLEELKRYDYDESHFGRYMFARDETGAIYAFDEQGPMVVDMYGEDDRVPPDRVIGFERVLDAYVNRDRWPDDVPRPYEDFSSKPPPSGPRRNRFKLWV